MQQNTSAMWAAIILLAALAGVFGVMSFNAQEEIQALKDKLVNGDPQNIASEYNNQKIKDFITQNLALSQQIQELNDTIRQARQDTGDAKLAYENQRAVTARRDEEIRDLKTSIANLQKTHKDTVERAQGQFAEEIRKRDVEIQNYKNWNDANQREVTKVKQDISDLNEATNTIVTNSERDRQTLAVRINALIQRLSTTATTEGVAGKTKTSDGKILVADTRNNVVQVSLGSLNKLQAGMIFDVTRQRYNRTDVMGKIEITKVGRTTSEGVILTKSVPVKMDPHTFWTTEDMNARYSPYITLPETDENGQIVPGKYSDKAVHLVTIDQKDVTSMNPLDPILPGDDIVNPLFTPDRMMHFVHIGFPIMLSRETIRAGVEDYGGVLEDESFDVDSTTDYLVIGFIPRESDVASSEEAMAQRKRMLEQEERAKQFGVPIIRETEFMNFIRN